MDLDPGGTIVHLDGYYADPIKVSKRLLRTSQVRVRMTIIEAE